MRRSPSSGLGRAHHRVLHFVNRHPGLRVADLLEILKITKQSLARVLKQLVDEGWIVQKAGERDRRQRLLHATEKGAALARRLDSLQAKRVAQALAQAGDGSDARDGALPVQHDLQGGARAGRGAAARADRGRRAKPRERRHDGPSRPTWLNGNAARQRRAHPGRRRRPAHPRPAGPLPVRAWLPRDHRHRRRERARGHARPHLRRRHPRRDDARRERPGPGARPEVDLQHPDLPGHRAGGARAAHRGPGGRRRRLRGQAVRAARAAAAAAEHPAARPGPIRAARRDQDGRLHLPRRARRAEAAARRPSSSPSGSATCCGCSRSGRGRRSPATSWPATIPPAASAPSTCRSTGCAARSRPIRPTPSTCKRSEAKAIYFTPTERAVGEGQQGAHARSQSR